MESPSRLRTQGLALIFQKSDEKTTRCNVWLTMLQHVTLEVTPAQVRACVAFWELLGFTEMEPPPMLRDRFTWVEREGTQIHLVPVDDPIVAREGHVAVIADDYAATLAHLEAEGFEVHEGSNAWDAARVFATDPAGHRIEVMSRPPHPPWPK
jgi:catechol 2,3-dioxygenase-like lactoylglutathione lyase family enzyme